MAENLKLKEEVSNIKEDFERLQDIFETRNNSTKTDNREAEVELADIREQFRVTKTENEFLREKNDTLFKLGRIALQKQKEQELEIIEDDDEDGLDALVNSTLENKKKGFRRAGPTTVAEKAKEPATKNANVENETNSRPTSPPNIRKETNHNLQYCHFFSNFGKCHFKETTGRDRTFSHKKAPQCNYDGNCNRKKCMFSHMRQMTPPASLSPTNRIILSPTSRLIFYRTATNHQWVCGSPQCSSHGGREISSEIKYKNKTGDWEGEKGQCTVFIDG